MDMYWWVVILGMAGFIFLGGLWEKFKNRK
jgi:hypothetical protein